MRIAGVRIRGTKIADANTIAVSSDEYFNLVSLLLPGNGTNGAQNNTFLDSSTNAFTITRNGNTTQGTFSPFSQTGWSNYFDGTGDYLTLSSNTSMDFGTGNFTIEGWFYTGSKDISGGASRTIIGNSGNGYTMQLYITTSGYLNFGNTGSTFIQGSTDLADNAWHYFAIARKGTGTNEIAMWVDGVRVAQGTNSQNYTSGTIFLGSFDASNGFWNGYLSNLRIVKGTAVYDASNSTITVPTSPLTAITNTSLLTCQSNRFIDNSTNAFAITANGNTAVQAFSPFDPATAYAAATVGGSGYFDGSGDYLSAAGNTAFAMSTGDFTIEVWVYPITIYTYNPLVSQFPALTLGVGYYTLTLNSSRNIELYYDGQSYAVFASATVTVNAWNHVAIARSGSTITGYINGAVAGTVTYSGVFGSSSTVLEIGGSTRPGGIYWSNAFISNVRLVKGTAVYTSAFTPPTAPLTSITNTSLLLNYTNGGITDAAAKNVLETAGGAAISTAQSKFGGSSMAFDSGLGSYLLLPSPQTQNFVFGSGDFTIEFFIFFTATAQFMHIYDQRPAATDGAYPTIRLSTGGNQLEYVSGAVVRIAGGSITTNVWYHVALSRSGTSTKLFLNGTQIGSTFTDTTSYLNGTNRPYIGRSGFHTVDPFYLSGYIDDLRITRGYARYTANFTPPTQAFPTQ